MTEKRGAYPPSAAPWNDGRRSFSTQERPAVYTEKKLLFLRNLAHFSQVSGDVLRTLCWAVFRDGNALSSQVYIARESKDDIYKQEEDTNQ